MCSYGCRSTRALRPACTTFLQHSAYGYYERSNAYLVFDAGLLDEEGFVAFDAGLVVEAGLVALDAGFSFGDAR